MVSKTPSRTRSQRIRTFVQFAVLIAVFVVGLFYIGHGVARENYERITGRVISIELTTQPADPNEQGEYTVKVVTSEWRVIVAPCAQSLCYMVQRGDKISVDITLWDKSNRLANPLEIIDRGNFDLEFYDFCMKKLGPDEIYCSAHAGN